MPYKLPYPVWGWRQRCTRVVSTGTRTIFRRCLEVTLVLPVTRRLWDFFFFAQVSDWCSIGSPAQLNSRRGLA